MWKNLKCLASYTKEKSKDHFSKGRKIDDGEGVKLQDAEALQLRGRIDEEGMECGQYFWYRREQLEGNQMEFLYLRLLTCFEHIDHKVAVKQIKLTRVAGTMAAVNNARNLLMMGPTGVGKTNYLELLINWYYGVKVSDNYRFRINEKVKSHESYESKTDMLTVYVLPYVEGLSKFPFPLRIIDTPGIGDTSGLEEDDWFIHEQLGYIFEKSDNDLRDYLSELHAILLVVNGTENKLNSHVSYCYSQLLSSLSCDVRDNLVALYTYTNEVYANASALVKKMANVCLELTNNVSLEQSKKPVNPDNQLAVLQSNANWEASFESCEELFNFMKKSSPISSTCVGRALLLKKDRMCEVQELKTAIKHIAAIHHSMRKMNKGMEKLEEREELKRNHTFLIKTVRKAISEAPVIKCENKTCRRAEAGRPCLTFNQMLENENDKDRLTWEIIQKDTHFCSKCGCHFKYHLRLEPNDELTKVVKLADKQEHALTLLPLGSLHSRMKACEMQKLKLASYIKKISKRLAEKSVELAEISLVSPSFSNDDSSHAYWEHVKKMIITEENTKKPGFQKRVLYIGSVLEDYNYSNFQEIPSQRNVRQVEKDVVKMEKQFSQLNFD